MIELLLSNPFGFILIFGGIIISIGIHEAAHAYMADYLGDPTPRSMGRTTLNPIAHLDPLGVIVMLFSGFFGWGKPAPYDPYNLKNPKRDTALIAFAGPLSNIVIAALLAFLLRAINMPNSIPSVILSLVIINVNLALFNLLPIPPLDGSKIIPIPQLPNTPIVLFLLILPIFGSTSIAYLLISPFSRLILSLLLPYN